MINNFLIIDLIKNLTSNYSVSIKDKFTSDMKDKCPIVSYSVVKVIEKKSGEPIILADSSNPFKLDSTGIFFVLESIQSYHNY